MSWNPFKDYDVSCWLRDLIAAVVGGGANAASGALSITLLDPKDFNPQTPMFWKASAMLFGTGALIALYAYLKQRPLPSLISETTHEHVQVTRIPLHGTGDGTVGNQPALQKTVTTTVEEKVELAPVPPEKGEEKK